MRREYDVRQPCQCSPCSASFAPAIHAFRKRKYHVHQKKNAASLLPAFMEAEMPQTSHLKGTGALQQAARTRPWARSSPRWCGEMTTRGTSADARDASMKTSASCGWFISALRRRFRFLNTAKWIVFCFGFLSTGRKHSSVTAHLWWFNRRCGNLNTGETPGRYG